MKQQKKFFFAFYSFSQSHACNLRHFSHFVHFLFFRVHQHKFKFDYCENDLTKTSENKET